MSSAAETDLLVEIGTEELPPTALSTLSGAFRQSLLTRLGESRVAHGPANAYASPRRLAVIVEQVAIRQRDETISRRGPAVSAAFTADGAPTKAAFGFARSCGVAVEALGRETSEKGSWLSFEQRLYGAPVSSLLAGLIEAALADLPIPKRMRWGDREVEFVRPVHWVCVRFGDETVGGEVLGLPIVDSTRGHRFHAPEARPVCSASTYLETLREAHVEPDFDARRRLIRQQIESLASEAEGRPRIDDDLLDEVTALCEWPVALLGRFDPEFLEVPPEVLIETMQSNQKYFPVLDAASHLLPCFLAVSNIDSKEPEQVRAGNERVIRPRFADAKFFWEQDLRTPLAERRDALAGIVFQQRLGSMLAKSDRIESVSGWIARQVETDVAEATRAAYLAKCDLVTLMVGEFGSLQGVMGRYYASASGESSDVAEAIEQHYWPKHSGDRLPDSAAGRAVALADRVDTLLGIFAVGGRPTGVKDPFGLRRAAIGVLRILIETPLALDLKELLRRAGDCFPQEVAATASVDEVFDYCIERLKRYYSETGSSQAVGADVVAAVLARELSVPMDIDRRVHAVARFRARSEARALVAANKRTRNILRKAGQDQSGTAIDSTLLRDNAEVVLVAQLDAVSARVEEGMSFADYDSVLAELATLGEALDRFFEEVMVMTEEDQLRANRLAILQRLETLFLNVADLSLLQE